MVGKKDKLLAFLSERDLLDADKRSMGLAEMAGMDLAGGIVEDQDHPGAEQTSLDNAMLEFVLLLRKSKYALN